MAHVIDLGRIKVRFASDESSSNAFGLIQCLPSTLARLGYSLDQVKGKYGEWQLEHLVLPYLKPYVGKMNSAYDVYLAIFSPVCLGKNDGYVIALEHEKAYRGNKVLDTVYGDHDGKLEVIDVKCFLSNQLPSQSNCTRKTVNTLVKYLYSMSLVYIEKIPSSFALHLKIQSERYVMTWE
jgi:hypothetical protein